MQDGELTLLFLQSLLNLSSVTELKKKNKAKQKEDTWKVAVRTKGDPDLSVMVVLSDTLI